METTTANRCIKKSKRKTNVHLKERPTFAEEWPNEYEEGLLKGKQRMEKIDNLRKTSYNINSILQKDILYWWNTI
jgi:hypothetical protein